MALCSVCRSPIQGVVRIAPNGKRAHWGCARWAALDSGLRGASEGDLEEASPCSDVSEAACRQLPWLEPWLESMRLSHCLQQAMAWCESMGATDMEEVKENWEELADFLQLEPAERASLSESATGSNSALGDSSGDPSGGDGWLESMQLPTHHPSAPSKAGEEPETFGPEGATYQLLERLGRGANAVVHRCMRGSEEFAVKVINLERLRMRPDFERLLQVLDRETSILWTLRHERVAQLRDVVRTPKRLYLVMDLIKGGELMDHIMSKGRFTEEEARYIFVQLVSGLQYIHGKNIVHRDLKPENILVDSEASRPGRLEIRLSDFGHSKLINDGYTCAHTVVGTPQYWAPEAAEAQSAGPQGYDERADLWSLGVVLYVMLEGAYPFESSRAARTGQFQFNGSTEAERLVRGLVRPCPAERLTLEQCLESAWVAGAAPAAPVKARSQGHEEQEVRLRLPRAPRDVAQFRADLATYSNEHQVPATLRLLEVLVSFRAGAAREAVDGARTALEGLVARHFPESAGRLPDAGGGQQEDKDGAAALEEERGTLAAIYGAEFEALDDADWRLSLGGGLALRIHLPTGYPREKPPDLRIEGARNKQGSAMLKELLSQWAPGDACIYQWTERLREALGGLAPLEGEEPPGEGEGGGNLPKERASVASCSEIGDYTYLPLCKQPGRGPKSVKQGQRQRRFGAESCDPANSVELIHGEALVDRKSTFQAHLACVSCIEQVNWSHRQLLSERKIAAATHNCIAYRFYDSATGSWVSDHDSDHEHGAGAILETLLGWCGDQGVFLMVTRWYGGTELGHDRFRHVKRVAQSLLEKQGLLKEVTSQKKGPTVKRKS